MFSELFQKIRSHKKTTALILLLLLAGGYFAYRNLSGDKETIKYLTAAVKKDTLIVSVSASGQAVVFDQIELKPKVSGEVASVLVKKGEEIKKGQLIATLDQSEYQKAINDAETSLETANLDLEELLKPVDELTLLQSENSLVQAKESKEKAEENLQKSYEDGFNELVSVFFDLPGLMSDLRDVLQSNDLSDYQDNAAAYADMARAFDEKVDQYKDTAINSYQLARLAYDQNFEDYKTASRYSDSEVIENLLEQTYETSKKIAEAIKNTDNLISFVKDGLIQRKLRTPAIISTHQSTVKNGNSKINSIISGLLSAKTTIKNNQDSIISSGRTIEEKELSLEKLKAGADELQIRAKKITIQQKEDALAEAKENLADCYIYSSLDGIIAELNLKKGDSVSSGTALATIITEEKIAEISLNEVDAAKVRVGQRASFTFDALAETTLSGEVVEVDTTGTVSQGVVSYGVKLSFDTGAGAIKPGMSLNAEIIVEAKPDVLLVPNSALKSEGNSYFVQLASSQTGTPGKTQAVEIGISSDLYTEVINGLKEGDVVISSTITGSSKTTNQSVGGQGFQIMGGGMR